MGFFSSLGSMISDGIRAVCTLASSVGGAIGAAVSVVNPVLGGSLMVAAKIADVVKSVLDNLGIEKPGATMQEVGDRMLQGADLDIIPENYSSFDEYRNALMSLDLDPTVSGNLSEEAKLLGALAYSVMALENKFGDVENVGSLLSLSSSNPEYFDSTRMTKMLESGGDMQAFSNYVKGNDTVEMSKHTESIMYKIDKEISPNMSDTEIFERLRSIE